MADTMAITTAPPGAGTTAPRPPRGRWRRAGLRRTRKRLTTWSSSCSP